MGPDVDDLVIAFAGGDETGSILLLDFLHLLLRSFDDARLVFRHDHVVNTDGNTGTGCMLETGIHQPVREDHGLFQAGHAIAGIEQTRDRALVQHLVDQVKGQPARQQTRQQRATDGGGHEFGTLLHDMLLVEFGEFHTHLATRMQRYGAGFESAVHFGGVGEDHAGALGIDRITGDVIQTQDHVLGRHDDRVAVGWRQDVIGRHHEAARFKLRLDGQRHVDRHLVTVEVGVERSTHQRMKLDGLAFDQYRLERLNAKTMQGRRTVQHHRMFADHLFEDIPHFRPFTLDELLSRLDGGRHAATLELAENKRLEQLQSHLLRQPTLVQLQGRADHDHRTTGVIDALAEQVLAEPTLLALDHVGQRLQGQLVGTSDGATTTTVVEQSVHRFLQHALLVAHDDVGRVEIEQTLQAIVTVDNATVQVVQIGSRETATIERHQRAQFRRQHRQHLHHHPFGTVA